MSRISSNFENRLNQILGQRAFVLTRDLVALGIYGNLTSARQALMRGDLPAIKLSPRRWGIPREKLIEFVRQRIKESTHD